MYRIHRMHRVIQRGILVERGLASSGSRELVLIENVEDGENDRRETFFVLVEFVVPSVSLFG